jgi:hypothetical protein
MTNVITTWQDVYRALRAHGLDDAQIAHLSGASRAVVNGVITGNYPFTHQPKYAYGVKLLARLQEIPDVAERINQRRVDPTGQFIPDRYTPRTTAGTAAGRARRRTR